MKLYSARYKDGIIKVEDRKIRTVIGKTIYFLDSDNLEFHIDCTELDNKKMHPSEIRSLDKDKAIDLLIEMLEKRIEHHRSEGNKLLKAVVSHGRG